MLSGSRMVHVPHSPQLLLIVSVHGTLRTASVRILPGCWNTSPSSFSLTWKRVSSSVWAETEGYLPVRAAARYPERRRPPEACLRFRHFRGKKRERGRLCFSVPHRHSFAATKEEARSAFPFNTDCPCRSLGRASNSSPG